MWCLSLLLVEIDTTGISSDRLRTGDVRAIDILIGDGDVERRLCLWTCAILSACFLDLLHKNITNKPMNANVQANTHPIMLCGTLSILL